MRRHAAAVLTSAAEPGQRFASDCTDAEWAIIAPLTAKPPGAGRKRQVDLRAVVNAIFYRTRTGCQWRMLPKAFPDWRHVWYYYHLWIEDGTWHQITAALCPASSPVGRDDASMPGPLDGHPVTVLEAGDEHDDDSGTS